MRRTPLQIDIERLKKICKTDKAVADELGIGERYVQMIREGKKPGSKTLTKLARLLVVLKQAA